MKTSFVLWNTIIIVTGCVIFQNACNRVPTTVQKITASSNKDFDLLFRLPEEKIGKTQEAFMKIKTCALKWKKEVANPYYPDQNDTISSITCDGLEAGFQTVTAITREYLIFVKLTKNLPGLLPDLIGNDISDLMTRYRLKGEIRGDIVEYFPESDEIGMTFIRFRLKDTKVQSVEWISYVD